MRLLRRFAVAALVDACDASHFIVHRRPWLWLPLPICPLANISMWLDERWRTGAWTFWSAETTPRQAEASGALPGDGS